jgi:cell division protein FtsN
VTTDRDTRNRTRRGRGWLFSLLGLALVAIPGFAVGLFAGVLWEDPGLILGDLAGDTEEVAWGPQPPPAPETDTRDDLAPGGEEAEVASAPPDVAAAPPVEPRSLPTAGRAAAPSAPARGKLSVQVGAFAESRAAEQLAETLRGAGLPVYVSPSAAAAGDQRWRVRVGPIATREEADRIASRLKTKEKLPTWVLTEDGT